MARPTMPMTSMLKTALKAGADPAGFTKEAFAQLNAGTMAGGNMILFDRAKEVTAAQLTYNAMGGSALYRRKEAAELYKRIFADLAAQERYDTEHRRKAQIVGQVAGAVGALAIAPEFAGAKLLVGAAGAANKAKAAGAVVGGARAAKAARAAKVARTPVKAARGQPGRLAQGAQATTKLAFAGGAASGAGNQVASDIIAGEVSSPRTYMASTVAGAIGAPVTKYLGSGAGGAIEGAISSAADASLNGRPMSMEEVMHAAVAGRIAGGVGGAWGTQHANGLSSNAKGKLGEQLSYLHSLALGKIPSRMANGKLDRSIVPIAGSYSVPDHRLAYDEIVEAKFGPYARTSTPQKAAISQMPGLYRVDHWMPEHFGNVVGTVASGAGVNAGEMLDAKRRELEAMELNRLFSRSQ